MRHGRALATITVAGALDAACGLWFAAAEHIPAASGLYWAVATATTVGYGDVIPRSPAGHAVAVIVMLTVIPLFGATFSLFTAGLTSFHVRSHLSAAEARIKEHTEMRLAHHLSAIQGNPGEGSRP